MLLCPGLRSIEEDTGTFLFMARDEDMADVLVVCGADYENRRRAEHDVHLIVQDVKHGRRGRGAGGGGYGDDWDAPSWRGGGRDRRDDGPYGKYRRDDDWDRGYGGGGYGGYGGRGYGGGYDRGYGGGYGYGDQRGGGGYGSRRSRSRSYDSRDSRDRYDRSRRRSRSRSRSRSRDWYRGRR